MPGTVYWEHFPHQADVGVRGLGETLEQAFEQAALAMTAAITDLDTVIAGSRIAKFSRFTFPQAA